MGCVRCGNSGIRNDKSICDCEYGKMRKPKIKIVGIPSQYQNLVFDKDFLNPALPRKYGEFMESLYDEILENILFYQKNHLICMKPNSGKNIWTYSLITAISERGFSVPQLRDIYEVQEILQSGNAEEIQLYTTSRCCFIKIPRYLQPWMFDVMSIVTERRVRNNGFTIYLYSGSYEELQESDKYGRLKYMVGSGAYNTMLVKSF